MEGVGVEVEVFLSCLLCVAICVAFLWHRFRESYNRFRNEPIHPEHISYIEQIRRSRLLVAPRIDDSSISTETVPTGGSNLVVERDMLEEDAACPVCLELYVFPVLTNCGHTFCARCFVAYWNHREWTGAMRCPVCRQQVNVLLRRSAVGESQRQRNSTAGAEAVEALEVVQQYNRRFSGEPRTWWEYLQDAPVLMRHLFTEFFSVGGLVLMFRVRVFICVLAGVIYLLVPLDILPEAVFGFIGLLDDLFIGLLVIIYLSILYRQYLSER